MNNYLKITFQLVCFEFLTSLTKQQSLLAHFTLKHLMGQPILTDPFKNHQSSSFQTYSLTLLPRICALVFLFINKHFDWFTCFTSFSLQYLGLST